MSCPLKVILNKHKKAISKMEVKKNLIWQMMFGEKKLHVNFCGNQYI